MSDCIPWTKSKDAKGYGYVKHRGKTAKAHRLAYCLAKGIEYESIRGMCVCHTCDNPSCINPDHLWLGAVADNNKDRDQKGRQKTPSGQNNPNSKLSKEDIAFILSSPESSRKLATKFNVTHSSINYHRRKNK